MSDQPPNHPNHPNHPQHQQHPRHHKDHKVHRIAEARRSPQIHGGGGRTHEEGEGLRLPRWRFAPTPGTFPFTVYPKGWRFNWLTPGRAALLLSGGAFLLLLACLALAKLLAG